VSFGVRPSPFDVRRRSAIAVDIWLRRCFSGPKVENRTPNAVERRRPNAAERRKPIAESRQMSEKTERQKAERLLAENRKAYHDYEILETYEAGLVLVGTEVKAIREGRVNLRDSYARVERGEVWAFNVHISPYSHRGYVDHQPLRSRKLLLHKAEIRKIEKRIEEKGLTVVPLRVFFNDRGFAKVELGICRGKQVHDKRAAVKKRETEREIRREMTRYK
jgi:SsrA-binding protein